MAYDAGMDLANIYQCFSHPDRIRVVALLGERPLCVQELQSILGLSQVEVSKHLACLRRWRFVVPNSSGTWRIYRIADDLPFELQRHLKCLRECIDHGSLLKQEFAQLRALQGKNTRTQRTTRPPRRAARPPSAPVVDEGSESAGTDLTSLEDHLL